MNEHKILRVKIMHDEDCRPPTENCGSWSIYTFEESLHHLVTDVPQSRFFDDDDQIRPELRKKLEEGFAFGLDYSEHGLGSYEVVDGDVSTIDGFVVWENDPSELGGVNYTREDRLKDAESFVDEYSKWANGECFGYMIDEVKSVAPDFDPDDESFNGVFWQEVDSCWGFIGLECVRDELAGILKDYDGYRIVFKGDVSYEG